MSRKNDKIRHQIVTLLVEKWDDLESKHGTPYLDPPFSDSAEIELQELLQTLNISIKEFRDAYYKAAEDDAFKLIYVDEQHPFESVRLSGNSRKYYGEKAYLYDSKPFLLKKEAWSGIYVPLIAAVLGAVFGYYLSSKDQAATDRRMELVEKNNSLLQNEINQMKVPSKTVILDSLKH